MLRPRRRSGELLAYPGLLLLLLSTVAVTFAAVSPTRTGLLAGRSGGRAAFAAVAAAVALGGGGGGGLFEALALSSPTTTARSVAQPAPPAAVNDIMRERFAALRSAVTGEKVSELRVGDTLVERLRAVDGLLDGLESDIYRDTIDWDVVSVYPKIFRAYSPLFTAYTDRAFPDNSEIESALRYALRYEVGGFYSGVQDFERAVERRAPRQAQRAFARMSISYDHYLKAGDLYTVYEDNFDVSPSYSNPKQLNYIAPSIEAPGLEDEVVLLKGPDKGRKGVVLWIFKDETLSNNIIVKLEKMGESGHSEVRQYPYSLVAKTTPPEVQFFDDLFAAYLASAISCGIMYPIDTYKTRVQIGKKGLPGKEEGGPLGLYRGVGCASSSIYLASPLPRCCFPPSSHFPPTHKQTLRVRRGSERRNLRFVLRNHQDGAAGPGGRDQPLGRVRRAHSGRRHRRCFGQLLPHAARANVEKAADGRERRRSQDSAWLLSTGADSDPPHRVGGGAVSRRALCRPSNRSF